jgi:signal transduction histidine kinase
VVAEALTNVAKHSGAGRCRVAVVLTAAGTMQVSVTDDGVGGAHEGKGSGLAGLVDRVHAAGGELRMTSPSGGPTTVYAEFPCRPDEARGASA